MPLRHSQTGPDTAEGNEERLQHNSWLIHSIVTHSSHYVDLWIQFWTATGIFTFSKINFFQVVHMTISSPQLSCCQFPLSNTVSFTTQPFARPGEGVDHHMPSLRNYVLLLWRDSKNFQLESIMHTRLTLSAWRAEPKASLFIAKAWFPRWHASVLHLNHYTTSPLCMNKGGTNGWKRSGI